MDRLMIVARRVSHAGGIFGGALLLAASFVVGIDVVLRKWWSVTLGGADELAGYALAISSAWGLAYALLHRVHIRIDSLYVLLPVRLCALLDIASVLAFAAFFGVVSFHAYFVFAQSVAADAHSVSPIGTPLMIPQALWVLGLVEFVLVAVLLVARGIQLLVRGDVAGVRRLLGSRSATEEVEDELKGLHGPSERPTPTSTAMEAAQ